MTKKEVIAVLEAIGKLSKDGVFVGDISGKEIIYANQSLVEIFDISHRSFARQLSFYINHVLHDDMQLLEEAYRNFVIHRKADRVHFRISTHDQSVKYLSISCYLLENHYIVGFVHDLTPDKEHEDYIIDYGAKKNTLLDMVTHNLSGPLQISRNLTESLTNALATGKQENIAAHVKLIKDNTQHCLELISDFLEEEHRVSQGINVKANRMDVVSKLNTILERFRRSYPDFTFLLSSSAPVVSLTNDDVKFLQVANNLISNAVKFSPARSTIRVHIEQLNNGARVDVIDQGIGITKKFFPVLFNKNTPAKRQGLAGEHATGMGLHIVATLTSLMQGEINFESEENKGSTFSVSLPSILSTKHI